MLALLSWLVAVAAFLSGLTFIIIGTAMVFVRVMVGLFFLLFPSEEDK